MPELSSENIKNILRDIERNGLRSNLLKDELLDHICCLVESDMTNGMSFEQAYNKASVLFKKGQLSRVEKNLSFWLNYKSILTSVILYLGIICFAISWIFQFSQTDWIGLISFTLIGFVFLRFSILFRKDKRLKNNKLLSALSGLIFVFFGAGSITRFLWLNYGKTNQHITALLIFSWLVMSLLALIYHYSIHYSPENRKRTLNMSIIVVQMLLAAFSMSTFFFPVIRPYIPQLAAAISIINLLSLASIVLYKQKGKGILKALLFSSTMIVFLYFPLKSWINPKDYTVQFKIKTQEKFQKENIYIHINYYKYGKETLKLNRENDNVFISDPILISGGGIKMAYKITSDSLNIFDVLQNTNITSEKIKLLKNDTVFTLYSNPK